MEKTLSKECVVSIIDNSVIDQPVVIMRSELPAHCKLVKDEKTGEFAIYNASGGRIYFTHLKETDVLKIEGDSSTAEPRPEREKEKERERDRERKKPSGEE